MQNLIESLAGHIPNQLTTIRILIVPILLFLYPFHTFITSTLCAILFAVAAASDFFDGYLARKWNMESEFGKLFDPIADKMLVSAALILVVNSGALPAWMAGLMICREVAISGLRLVAQEKSIKIEVIPLGKLKTMLQLLGLECLLINHQLFGWYVKEVGMIAIWGALIAGLYSAYEYFLHFKDEIEKNTADAV